MTSAEIRQQFLNFFAARGHKHKIVPSSSLIPTDPSVLLTTAGMQQFKPYYTGAADPLADFGSKNVVSIQKSFRTSDIDEVGDDSHLTFFEMLGNFSFGGYGKKEAIEYAHEFITKDLRLKIDYVTVFAGDDLSAGGVPKDEEAKKVWQTVGITDIRERCREDNFWGPTGSEGPCGPTTEIYVGGVEIWNLVFNEYYRRAGGSLEKLSTLGVDTGMGLERLTMVVQGRANIFETDLFDFSKTLFCLDSRVRRIIADHSRASVFLIDDGVKPSNKGSGYILRRLIRRVIVQTQRFSAYQMLEVLIDEIEKRYGYFYKNLNGQSGKIKNIFDQEHAQLQKSLGLGLVEFYKKYPEIKAQILQNGQPIKVHVPKFISAEDAFYFHQTFGLTIDIIKDLAKDGYHFVDEDGFQRLFEKHQAVSRAGMVGKFAGGLSDHEPETIKLHTAHHLLLAALQQIFGKQVKQRGSNINQERLRFDFSFNRKLTDEERKKLENLVNEKIVEDLPVTRKEMSRIEAEKLGAEMEFGQKYGEQVSVYFIGQETKRVFSVEFCGGPHVSRTGELGKFKIIKDEPVAAGVRRIKAILK